MRPPRRAMKAAPRILTRRGLLAAGGGAFAAGLARDAGACGDGTARATRAQTPGPFYVADAPFRADLREPGADGRELAVRGRVIDIRCRPVANALLDLWHADPGGAYDLAGHRFRARLEAGADGTFAFRTFKPGHYPGRTPHVHVKVVAPKARPLTTQLYFPGEAGSNARDFLYRDELLLGTAPSADGPIEARFDFVLVPA